MLDVTNDIRCGAFLLTPESMMPCAMQAGERFARGLELIMRSYSPENLSPTRLKSVEERGSCSTRNKGLLAGYVII